MTLEHDRCAAGSATFKSHRRAVLSTLPVTTQRLSGLKVTARTPSSWPLSTTGWAAGSPAFKSHSRAVRSRLQVTTQRLSELKGNGANPILMAFEHDRLSCGIGRFQIPQARCVVPACGNHPAVVRAKGHGENLALMANQRASAYAGESVAQSLVRSWQDCVIEEATPGRLDRRGAQHQRLNWLRVPHLPSLRHQRLRLAKDRDSFGLLASGRLLRGECGLRRG